MSVPSTILAPGISVRPDLAAGKDVLDGDIVGNKIFDVVAVLLSQFYRGWPRIGRMTSITVKGPHRGLRIRTMEPNQPVER